MMKVCASPKVTKSASSCLQKEDQLIFLFRVALGFKEERAFSEIQKRQRFFITARAKKHNNQQHACYRTH